MAAAAPAAPEQVSANKQFGGWNRRYKHASTTLGCSMNFTVYLPPGADAPGAKFPVVWYLSGLTCTDENVIQKSGAQRACAASGVALVASDTSPRGLGVEGEAEAWDFGVGAGFYINATVDKWRNWRMYDYITKELPELLAASFPNLDMSNTSIMGHSMGGHGALTIALKNPGRFKSVSAFSPICNPVNVPWGQKAFAGYLGDADKEAWKQHDASELMAAYTGPKFSLLVDTGSADPFLTRELRPETLEAAAAKAGFPLTSRMQEGYDHSYFFISTFMDDHIEHHAKALLG